ncbi:hypothetical protein GN958_ATG05435 [Phytophthora infestans]|uniref:Uncharacterized protein n=1 Tax=Phytophthora infestans TaxID=4787 RepID=A0A8S9UWH9_PHYIN|nr:hypothetical protein GN958_ATG05435 [Phytophthora infestans]
MVADVSRSAQATGAATAPAHAATGVTESPNKRYHSRGAVRHRRKGGWIESIRYIELQWPDASRVTERATLPASGYRVGCATNYLWKVGGEDNQGDGTTFGRDAQVVLRKRGAAEEGVRFADGEADARDVAKKRVGELKLGAAGSCGWEQVDHIKFSGDEHKSSVASGQNNVDNMRKVKKETVCVRGVRGLRIRWA